MQNRRKSCLVILLSALVAGTVPATIDLARDKYDIDSAHSMIGFSVDFMGLSKVEGRFSRYAGTVLYDEADITNSSVSLLILADSISTAAVSRDNHLKTADFFDAQKFPAITFQSLKTVKQGDGFVLIGPLTLHGVTREVAIACKLTHPRTTADMWGNPRVGFDGRVMLNRKHFGIGSSPRWEGKIETGAQTIGDEVEIRLFISARILNFDKVSGGPAAFDTPLWKTYEENGFEALAAQYKQSSTLPPEKPEDLKRREGAINRLAHKLLWRNKVKEALTVFEWNVAAFPNSAAVYDGLAEAQARAGDFSAALANYRKSLEMDPQNSGAMEMVRYLGRQK